ncbi:MAG TPA: UDP-N-acetylglucosamine 2-epimerase (non-hydrolyzing), partial [Bacteroidia bacterium]|nr:UDP-N-acetylglucosamine 2-epimerase (non-hydrolyzing) [Bacteroidia bacterium]
LIPDYFLNTPPGSAVFQMAHIMLGLEKAILQYKPDLVMVVGDVNSTFAAALTANKMDIPLAHLESGLRSYDRTMPEEFNRVLTDSLSDYFFVTEQSGYDSLLNEGVNEKRLFFVGNTMIDTLVAFKDQIHKSDILQRLDIEKDTYVLMTMHRPATVDSAEGLEKLLGLVELISRRHKLVFPIHPRTLKNIRQFGMEDAFVRNKNLILSEPLDYFAFQKLVAGCRYILTDSGGIQEESTFLRVPCLTLRPNTERPVTVTLGTNELVPFDLNAIGLRIGAIEAGLFKKGIVPPLWDGRASERIVELIAGGLRTPGRKP